ncbi:hypothetical protein I3842_11G181300 [Carya illinoinensis]|uniref:Late embryogenesis abundant protein LEA-2 subgroup domain-containing protein n=1 Tax=Carya illinoinensis TaxID=32201 RepID=A0A922DRT6_CARIL|nr:hypothetical protein I3842_11G181300 [Carya illinoinensis]
MRQEIGPAECCKWLFCLICFIVITCLAIWVFVGVDDPKSSIQSLYLPTLNKTSLDSTTPTTNNTLFFELKLSNSNDHRGIYYGGVELTFYDNPISTRSHVIGNYTIPQFYQGYNKKATKRGAVEVNTTLVSQAFNLLPKRIRGFSSRNGNDNQVQDQGAFQE